jgi:hypothetical protein
MGNSTSLLSSFSRILTSTLPVVAPVGTVVVISEFVTTLMSLRCCET